MSRGSARIPIILKRIEEVWKEIPDFSLIELLATCMPEQEDHEYQAFYHVRDEQILDRLNKTYGWPRKENTNVSKTDS